MGARPFSWKWTVGVLLVFLAALLTMAQLFLSQKYGGLKKKISIQDEQFQKARKHGEEMNAQLEREAAEREIFKKGAATKR